MLKQITQFLLFVALTFSGTAQTISTQVSESEKGGHEFEYSVRTKNGFLILKTDRSRAFMSLKTKIETTLLLTDINLNPIQEIPFAVPDADYISIFGLQNIGGKCYFFYKKRLKKSDEESFCGMQIDENNIQNSKEIVLGTFQKDKSDINFQLKVALDSSCYLLFAEPGQKKQDNKNFYFSVFDLNLNKIWDKNVELTTQNRFIEIYGITCKKQDKVYVSYKHYINEIKRESIVGDDGSRIPSYKTNILVFKQGEEQAKDVHLNLNDKFVHTSDIVFNHITNKVNILGTYKNKNNGHVNGVYNAEMDVETNELSNIKKTPFPQNLVELIKKDGFASKKESDPGLFIPYTSLDPIIRENGSIDYLLEYRLLTIVTYYNGKTSYSVPRYTYGSIIDAHFENEKVNFVRIPKYQVQEAGNTLLSIYPLLYHNKLILLYNDDKDNADKELDKSPDKISSYKRGVLMAASIDENSKLSRDIIMDNKKSDDFVTRIPKVQKIDNNTLIFTQEKAKIGSSKTRYGTLSIN